MFFLVVSSIHRKIYYVPRAFRADFVSIRSVCQSYGMEFLSLDTEEEAHFFMDMCQQNYNELGTQMFVGAMTTVGKSLTNWYWVSSGNKVMYSLPFNVNEPNFNHNNEWCLATAKNSLGGIAFNDLPCSGYHERFFCQKLENLTESL